VSVAPHVLVPAPLVACAIGSVIPLPAETMNHLRRALRRVDGNPLSLTDGMGVRAPAELAADGARLTGSPIVEGPASPRLVLAQALAKGRRVEDAVRMACELGVDRIVPVIAERTQGRPDQRGAAAVVERWGAVARAALEQSRGVRLPEITPCRTTQELAADVQAAADDALASICLVAVPGAPALPDALDLAIAGEPRRKPSGASPEEVWIAVGPEGGWTEGEVELLVGSGWRAVGLGTTVLRTEHAGPVAVAVISALSGRWRDVLAATSAP
jgi:16S rRNA (uracil1498-N3)-methyltransferase